MSGREILLAWMAAVLIAAGSFGWLLFRPLDIAGEVAERCEGRRTGVMFVGSSLTRDAIPHGWGIFARMTISAPDEANVLELFRGALECDVRMIAIEAQPLTQSTSGQFGPGIAFMTPLRVAMRDARRSLDGLITATSGKVLGPNVRPARRNAVFRPGPDDKPSRDIVPRQLEAPDIFRDLITEAKRRGIRVALIEYPRSDTAALWVGEAETAELQANTAAVAREFGIDLFQTETGSWPDDHFRDRAHMNARGSRRMLGALATWLEGLR